MNESIKKLNKIHPSREELVWKEFFIDYNKHVLTMFIDQKTGLEHVYLLNDSGDVSEYVNAILTK